MLNQFCVQKCLKFANPLSGGISSLPGGLGGGTCFSRYRSVLCNVLFAPLVAIRAYVRVRPIESVFLELKSAFHLFKPRLNLFA